MSKSSNSYQLNQLVLDLNQLSKNSTNNSLTKDLANFSKDLPIKIEKEIEINKDSFEGINSIKFIEQELEWVKGMTFGLINQPGMIDSELDQLFNSLNHLENRMNQLDITKKNIFLSDNEKLTFNNVNIQKSNQIDKVKQEEVQPLNPNSVISIQNGNETLSDSDNSLC